MPSQLQIQFLGVEKSWQMLEERLKIEPGLDWKISVGDVTDRTGEPVSSFYEGDERT
jgi:hypothetical protein